MKLIVIKIATCTVRFLDRFMVPVEHCANFMPNPIRGALKSPRFNGYPRIPPTQLVSFLEFKMAKSTKDPSSVNFVHQNAMLCETIRKEQRNQKLYTSYSINPFKKSKCGSFSRDMSRCAVGLSSLSQC